MKPVACWMVGAAMVISAATAVPPHCLGQGTIGLGDANPNGFVDVDNRLDRYTGTFGIEVWALNATAVPAGVNLAPGPGSAVAGYNAMRAAGFVLAATIPDQTMSAGVFGIGAVTLPPGNEGPTGVLAVAVWNTPAPSWQAMLSSANAATRAGVIAFVNPVTPRAELPELPAALTGWTDDLVMSAIPEPSALAVAAAGGALVFWAGRRRPRRAMNRPPP